MRIVFATTCKNRTMHLRETLPRNLADNPRSKFIILNYSSTDNLLEYLFSAHKSDIEQGRLVVYSNLVEPKFRMAHAKNQGHRCGMLEGADILVTLDADNFTGPKFEDFIETKMQENGVFLCPRVMAQGGSVRIAPRGVAGRLVVRTQDFIKSGGYDEKYDTWRGEDVDLIARLRRMGYAPRFIDPIYLDAIRHGNALRFAEYPHAEQYENDKEIVRINAEKHTVVNSGQIGCGTVYRNMDGAVHLGPLPTRIFGIGFQRTATTSLHRAFEILGFDSFHFESGDKARDIWDQMMAFDKSWRLERYYALSDNPIPMLYRELDKAYPGSKFVLTVRNEASWLRSVEKLWDPHHNPERGDWDIWPISNRLHRALYGRIDFDAPTFLDRYRRHSREALDYFKDRPGDLLVMDMERASGWTDLCRFLGVPVPHVPYPHANRT